jgi:hypothetical protein
MRKKNQKQISLMIIGIDHEHAVELEGINKNLDDSLGSSVQVAKMGEPSVSFCHVYLHETTKVL